MAFRMIALGAIAFMAGCGGINKKLYSGDPGIYFTAVTEFNQKSASTREKVVAKLVKKLASASSVDRDMAVIALGNIEAGSAVPEIISSYKICVEHSGCNRGLYFEAFGKIGPAASAAVPLLSSEVLNWNRSAIMALGSIGPGAVAAVDSLGEAYFQAKRIKGYEDWANLVAHTLHSLGSEGSSKVKSVKERISKEEDAEKAEKEQRELADKKRQEEIKLKQKKKCPALLVLMRAYQSNGQNLGLSIGYEELSARINKTTAEWSRYECDSWFSSRLGDERR